MRQLEIECLVMGVCQTNCYIVNKKGCGEAVVIDPADQGDRIREAAERKGLRVAGILLTHAHFDHIWGSGQLRELTGARIYAWEEERELCGDAQLNVSAQMGRPYTVEPDVWLRDGEEITVAGISFRVIGTPGHTKGSCCYYGEEERVLFSGDTLFEESVGRTDFPTGSMGSIVRSIKEKLFVLPDEVKVCPGHGGRTSIAFEKQYNPFCA